MKTKLFIFSLLFTVLISCNQKNENSFEGKWCISKVDYQISDQKADSMGLSELFALNLSKDEQPTHIVISKDTIKVLLNSEIIDKAYYKVEKKSDNITSILLKDKYTGILTKLEDGYSLKVDYLTYFYKKCN